MQLYFELDFASHLHPENLKEFANPKIFAEANDSSKKNVLDRLLPHAKRVTRALNIPRQYGAMQIYSADSNGHSDPLFVSFSLTPNVEISGIGFCDLELTKLDIVVDEFKVLNGGIRGMAAERMVGFGDFVETTMISPAVKAGINGFVLKALRKHETCPQADANLAFRYEHSERNLKNRLGWVKVSEVNLDRTAAEIRRMHEETLNQPQQP